MTNLPHHRLEPTRRPARISRDVGLWIVRAALFVLTGLSVLPGCAWVMPATQQDLYVEVTSTERHSEAGQEITFTFAVVNPSPELARIYSMTDQYIAVRVYRKDGDEVEAHGRSYRQMGSYLEIPAKGRHSERVMLYKGKYRQFPKLGAGEYTIKACFALITSTGYEIVYGPPVAFSVSVRSSKGTANK